VRSAIATGSRTACVSARGAFDMVGNVYEWVADWVPGSTTCGIWSPNVSPTDDDQCLAGPGATGEPSALLRGGNFFSGALAGPHAVIGSNPVSGVNVSIGFRCAR
jgi:formylglycine-generating enzyme required for sulfatase activity